MGRCDLKSVRVSPGDTYTIRLLDANPGKKYLPEWAGEYVSHYFIDIKSKEHGCFITFGLKKDMGPNSGKGGIMNYGSTEMRSPDFSDSKCSYLYNKCLDNGDSDCEDVCIGGEYVLINSKEKILRGKIVTEEGQQMKSELNDTQSKIINWFLSNCVDDTRPGRSKSYVAKLPFTFSFTPDRGSIIDWGAEEYFNCQKFANVFHNSPERIAKALSIV